MDYKKTFYHLYKGFFSTGNLEFMEENEIYEELIMKAGNFDYEKIKIYEPENIDFKFVNICDSKEMEKLWNSVALVDEDWVQYFKDGRIYCGYMEDEIVSFCIIDEMGSYETDGKILKIGGPGCVGTVPEFRKKGIGLKMVLEATKILFDEGFDISWIHYTGVGRWYEKLGYVPVLKWNKKGFID